MNFMGENTKVPKRWMDIDNMPFEHLLYMKYRQKGSDELHFLLKNSPVVGFDVKCQLCKKLFKVSELRAHFSTVKHLKKMNEVAELHYNQEERIMQLIAKDNASQTTLSRLRYASSIFEEVHAKDEPRSCPSQTVDNGNNTVNGQDTVKVAQTGEDSHSCTKQIKKRWPIFDMEDSNGQRCSKEIIKEKNAGIPLCSAAHVLNLYLDFWPKNNLPKKALYEFSTYENWRKEKVKANECDEGILSVRDSKLLGQGKPKTSYNKNETDGVPVSSYDINLHSLGIEHKINPAENKKTEVVQTCKVVTETTQTSETSAANIPKRSILEMEGIHQLRCCPQKSIKKTNASIEPCSSVHFLNLYLDFWPPSNVFQNALHEFSNYAKWRKEKVAANGCDDVVLSLCEIKSKHSCDTDEKDATLVPSGDITSHSTENQLTVNATENDKMEVVQICNVVTETPQTPAANIPKYPTLCMEGSNQLQCCPPKSIKENNAVTESCSSVHLLNLYMDFWPQSHLHKNVLSECGNNEKRRKEKVKANEFDEVVLSPCESQFVSQGKPKLPCDTDQIDDNLVPSIDIVPHSLEKQHTITDAENKRMEVVQTCNEIPQITAGDVKDRIKQGRPALSSDTDKIDDTLVPSIDMTSHFQENQNTINDIENDRIEVVQTCNELPQKTAVNVQNRTFGQEKSKLSCDTDNMDDSIVTAIDITPQSLENQPIINDAENDRMEAVQTCNEIPQTTAGNVKDRILRQETTALSCDTDKIDYTFVPSIDMPHSLENQHSINNAQNDRMEVGQTCNKLPQTTAVSVKNFILGQGKPKLSCATDKIDDTIVTAIDITPQSVENQPILNDAETNRMEVVQTCNEIPQKNPGNVRDRILKQVKPARSCGRDKIDDTLEPSIDITSHSLENQNTINDAENYRTEVVQTCNEIPQTTVANIPKNVYNMLQMRDLLKIKFRTKNTAFRPMFSKDNNNQAIVCHICSNNYTLHTKAHAVKHILEGEVHIRKMNQKVVEIYHPECSWLQFTNGMTMHENFVDLVAFLADPPSNSLEEFVEAMKQPIDNLLKVVILEPSGEWNSMLTFENNLFACNLCKRMQLSNESEVKEHCQSIIHMDNGKFMLQSYGNSASEPKLIEQDEKLSHQSEMQSSPSLKTQDSKIKQFMSKCAGMSIDELLNIKLRTADEDDLYMITRNKKQYTCNLCRTFTTAKVKEIGSHLLSENHLTSINYVKEFKHPEYYGLKKSSVEKKLEKIVPVDIVKGTNHNREPIAKKVTVKAEAIPESVISSFNDNDKKWFSELISANEENIEISPAHKQILEQFMLKCAQMSINEILKIQYRTLDEDNLYMIKQIQNLNFFICCPCKINPSGKAKQLKAHLLSRNHLDSIHNVKEFKHPAYYELLESSVETNVGKLLPVDVLESANDSWEPIAENAAVEAKAVSYPLAPPSKGKDEKRSCEKSVALCEKQSTKEETSNETWTENRNCALEDLLDEEIVPPKNFTLGMFKRKYIDLSIANLLKTEYRLDSIEWKFMIVKDGLQYVCNLCDRLSLDSSLSVKKHVRSARHSKIMQNILEINHPIYCISIAKLEEATEKYNEKMKRSAKTVPKAKNQNPDGAMNLKEFKKTYTKMNLKDLLEIQYRKKPADWKHMLKIIDGQYYCNLCGGELLGSRKNLQSHISKKTHSTSIFSVNNLYHPTIFPDAMLYTPKPNPANIEEYVNGARLSTLPDAEGSNEADAETSDNSTSYTKPQQENNSQSQTSDIVVASSEINSKTLTIQAFKLNYINLPAEELMKIEYKKNPASDWNLMIHENPVQYRCNLCCRIKLKDAENVVSHLNSNFHILNMESIKAMYNPGHYLLQNGGPSNKANSSVLKEEKRLEEFKLKYAEMDLDDILKVQFKTSGNTWQYMIENEEIRYLCILCWRISLRTKDDISSHVRTSFHRDNMKEVADLHHPICFPSKGSFEKTKLPTEKRTHKIDKKAKAVNFASQTFSSNEKSIGRLDSNTKGVSDDSKSSDVINGVLKLIAEHEERCKNKHCDLDCVHADIRARAYLIDDYDRIDDAIKNRGGEIIDEYEKMKRNQSKLMQSIKSSNVKSNLKKSKGTAKPMENDSSVKTVTKTINEEITLMPNLISPKNSLNISSVSPIQKPKNKKNPTQKHSTTKSSNINNENVSPISDNEDIMKLLRHISALENLLGSLGPRSTELLKKTFQLYKENSYYSPSSEDILLFETIREKLVGLLEIDVLTSKEIAAVKQVLVEIKEYIKHYEEHSVTLET